MGGLTLMNTQSEGMKARNKSDFTHFLIKVFFDFW